MIGNAPPKQHYIKIKGVYYAAVNLKGLLEQKGLKQAYKMAFA
jgi:hypothetical protein